MLQLRQRAAQLGNRFPVQPLGCYQDLGITALQALADRFRAERREKWTEDAGVFQRAKRCGIKRWDPACQSKYAIPLANA